MVILSMTKSVAGDVCRQNRSSRRMRARQACQKKSPIHLLIRVERPNSECKRGAYFDHAPCHETPISRHQIGHVSRLERFWKGFNRIANHPRMPGTDRSFERALERDSTLSGRLVARWFIGAKGRVTNVQFVDSELPMLHRCLRARILRWQFRPPDGGGTVEVNYPFIFKPTD